jgi:hypothetical protein
MRQRTRACRSKMRAGLFGFIFVIGVGMNLGIVDTAPAIGLPGALAQSQTETLTIRFGRWTRARFQAAKKHWGEHEQWFSDCNRELEAFKKHGRRMSYGRQAEFLEDCIRQRH